MHCICMLPPFMCPGAQGASLVPGCQPCGPHGVGKKGPWPQDVGSLWQLLGATPSHSWPTLAAAGAHGAVVVREHRTQSLTSPGLNPILHFMGGGNSCNRLPWSMSLL